MATTQRNNATTLEAALFTERTRLVRLCAQWTGDATLAEDLAQETLLIAWQNGHQLRDPARWSQWVKGIARNLCCYWWRKQHVIDRRTNTNRVYPPDVTNEPTNELTNIPDAFDLEIELERQELAILLDRALAQLPPLTRAVLIERYIHEAPQAEVAHQLKISEGAVEARIHRGKLMLRRILTTELQDDAAAFGLGVALADDWQKTRLWCPSCGERYLQGRFSQNGNATLMLRCSCGLNSCTRNMDGLFDGIQGYRAALTRAAQWRYGYLQTGLQAGNLACLGCGRSVPLHSARASDLPADFADLALADTPGRWAQCHHCGWRQQFDLAAIAGVVPAAQTFWRQHKRIATLPIRQVDYAGAAALVVGFQSMNGSDQLDLLFHPQSLSLLALQQT